MPSRGRDARKVKISVQFDCARGQSCLTAFGRCSRASMRGMSKATTYTVSHPAIPDFTVTTDQGSVAAHKSAHDELRSRGIDTEGLSVNWND